MKKTILALAALATFAVAPAFAQVTLYGTADAAISSVRTTGAKANTGLVSGANRTSNLGFKGTEDLGGGVSVNFVLEQGVNLVTGQAGETNSLFNRQSTVGLSSTSLGSLTLGRQYTPTFKALVRHDMNKAAGIGQMENLVDRFSGVRTNLRADGLVSYTSPTVSGFTGEVALNGNNVAEGSRYAGLNLGYAAGPFAANVGYGETKMIAGDFKQTVLGATYDLEVAKLMALFVRGTQNSVTSDTYSVSAMMPAGPGSVRVGLTHVDTDNVADNSAYQFAVGYDYNLSKRTVAYANASLLKNDAASTRSLDATASSLAGGKSAGLQFGLRHAF